MEPLGPLKLAPQPIARPWGGRMLADRYGKPIPVDDAPLGETWEASDLEDRVSLVASGPHAGSRLTDVLGKRLPLLLKLIDATEVLSLQVHPDEQAAGAIGRGALPKTEAWHILWSEPGAFIFFGARQGVTTDQLLEACQSGETGEVEQVLQKYRVSMGDTIFVPAGTIHAIGPGIVLYEIQQPSDTTFRLFDWGRVGLDGKPRKLHLSEAQMAIRGPTCPDPRRETELVPGANPRIMLARCPAFRLDLILVDRGELVIPESRHVTFFTCIGGDGFVRSDAGQQAVARGDTFCIPSEVDFMLKPGPRAMRLLHARIPKQG